MKSIKFKMGQGREILETGEIDNDFSFGDWIQSQDYFYRAQCISSTEDGLQTWLIYDVNGEMPAVYCTVVGEE